jgi:hypothetical protein
MKLQHHLTPQGNALTGSHAAPSERQVRECPLNNDTLAGVMDRANLCRILNGDPVVVAAGIGLDLSQENGKSSRCRGADPPSYCVERALSSAFRISGKGRCALSVIILFLSRSGTPSYKFTRSNGNPPFESFADAHQLGTNLNRPPPWVMT